jgi:hypothetical protein
MTSQSEYPHGDSFEVLPADGNLPALILGSTESEASRPGYKRWKQSILSAHEAPLSLSRLLASASLALFRGQRVLVVSQPERVLLLRICIAFQRIVTWALCFSLRHSSGGGE